MSTSKRIIITVPEALLVEIDAVTALEDMNRSELVREAIVFYLLERKRRLFIEEMKKGYQEMADLNINIASDNLSVEEEALSKTIEKIME